MQNNRMNTSSFNNIRKMRMATMMNNTKFDKALVVKEMEAIINLYEVQKTLNTCKEDFIMLIDLNTDSVMNKIINFLEYYDESSYLETDIIKLLLSKEELTTKNLLRLLPHLKPQFKSLVLENKDLKSGAGLFLEALEEVQDV